MTGQLAGVDRLVVGDASGVWIVQSASPTIYVFDADAYAIYRLAQADSPSGPSDHSWCPLEWVEARGDQPVRGEIRVGQRAYWAFEGVTGPEFWLQRPVIGVHRVLDETILAPVLPRLEPRNREPGRSEHAAQRGRRR